MAAISASWNVVQEQEDEAHGDLHVGEQEMLEASSCSVDALHLDGIPVPLLRYGREPQYRSRRPARCGDCGVRAGGYHHVGCDLAQCPSCKSQLLSCECRYDEDLRQGA